MEKAEMMEKVTEKLKGIRTASLTTIAQEGHLVSRPMATQEVEFDGTIWFMTSKDSDKAQHITADPKVGLSYSSSDSIRFVSVSGTAELVRDQEMINELWNDFYKAWFEGPEDPNIVLIKVTAQRIEYWDTPGGKLVAYATMAKSVLTGDSAEENDENEVFTLN